VKIHKFWKCSLLIMRHMSSHADISESLRRPSPTGVLP
jgi:hypothetical protein